MSTTPNTSSAPFQPRIHHASAIRNDPALELTIRSFVNEGYRYIAPRDAERWDPDPDERLPDADSLNQELGQHGFFAVLYDPNNSAIPIACAATTPWKGDLESGGKGNKGWEIKTVTSALQWMRGGFAGRCIDAIVQELVDRERARNQELEKNEQKEINVWVQTVECVNGAYWKKKGWEPVRAYQKPVGHWGSREGYQLTILLRKVDVL